jgi:hypothetical protein
MKFRIESDGEPRKIEKSREIERVKRELEMEREGDLGS